MSLSRLRLKTRYFSLSFDVPPPLAACLRWLRRTAVSGKGQGNDYLTVAQHLPVLSVQRRDPMVAATLYRNIRDRRPTAKDQTGEESLSKQVAAAFWYHTIELPQGIVTPGTYDHRPLLSRYGIPQDLRGKRTLDVATFDGFWAFEMERRGADVVATDVARFSESDFPPPVREVLVREDLDRETGTGFRIAHKALKSKVDRVVRSVYELDPEDLGTFDLVHVADLLLHLESPLAALRSIRRVTGRAALITDCFDPNLDGDVTRYLGGWASVPWWLPSLDTLVQMILDAGFSDVELQMVYTLGEGNMPGGHHRASLLATP